MGRTPAQQNAAYLLRELSIDDPHNELRIACAHLQLSVSGMRTARKEAARGDSVPLGKIVASLEARGVSSDMARRICGIHGLDSDGPKRPRDAASEDGATSSSSKAARATPADEAQSESDAESEGARPLHLPHSACYLALPLFTCRSTRVNPEHAAPSTSAAPDAWVCGHGKCGSLADKDWAEEIGPAGETLRFCTAHFDAAPRPEEWRPALTLHYFAAGERANARVKAQAIGPGADDDDDAALREELTLECDAYLRFKAGLVGEVPGSLNGSRELLDIAMTVPEDDDTLPPNFTPAWVTEPRPKPLSTRKRRGKAKQQAARKRTKAAPVAVKLTEGQQKELQDRYTRIASLVRTIVNREHDAGKLAELAEKLRPGATVGATVIPRAVELIIAPPTSKPQRAHKDYITRDQVQVTRQ
jgi:hypothetical protein